MFIEIITILFAATIAMFIGAGYYTLFSNVWMKLAGISKTDLEHGKQNMGATYFSAFVALLVTAFVIAYLMNAAGMIAVEGGITIAFLSWLGFAAPVTLQRVIWEGESLKLYLFSNTQNLLSFLSIGIILGLIM